MFGDGRQHRRFAMAFTLCLLSGCASTGESDNSDQGIQAQVNEVAQSVRDTAGALLDSSAKSHYAIDVQAPENLIEPILSQTYLGRWQRRADYHPDQFEGLLARLPSEVQSILRSRGHFNGSVSVQRKIGGVAVSVTPGPQSRIVEVDIEVAGAKANKAHLQRFAAQRWSLPKGKVFDVALWQQGKRALIESLHQRGYLRARIVSSSAAVHRKLNTVVLKLVVDSGRRISFGTVSVEGLSRYSERVVQDLRPFSAGDPYSLEKLLNYQVRLRESRYFDRVSVLPDLTTLSKEASSNTVNLKVKVIELQSKRAVLGVGVGTDEGPRGQIGLDHRDLFNRDWQLESALVVSGKRQRAFGNVRTPYNRTNHFFGFGGRVEREDIEGETTTRSNTYFGRGRRQGDLESFISVQYQIERQRLDGSASALGQITSQRALVFGVAWNLRRIDSTIDPRNGYTLSAQLSGAHEKLVSDQSFARFHVRATRFLPLPAQSIFRHGSLVLLSELGIVSSASRHGIPTENLFRTGGAQTVRGYRYLSLGVPDAGATVGGRYLAFGSLEYRHHLSKKTALAAFFDYGNAGDSRGEFKAVAGYGLGGRWATPVGPVKLDVAYGRELSRWRLHLSVGNSF